VDRQGVRDCLFLADIFCQFSYIRAKICFDERKGVFMLLEHVLHGSILSAKWLCLFNQKRAFSPA